MFIDWWLMYTSRKPVPKRARLDRKRLIRWGPPLILISICPIASLMYQGPIDLPMSDLWLVDELLNGGSAFVLAISWIPTAPLIANLYRRHRYREDSLWWMPPVILRHQLWFWYGMFGGGTLLYLMLMEAVPFLRHQRTGFRPSSVLGVFDVHILAMGAIGMPLAMRVNRAWRRIQSLSEPHCWNCLYNVAHIHPDSDACPECGFSVSESISRWKVCPKAFRPQWVRAVEDKVESPVNTT